MKEVKVTISWGNLHADLVILEFKLSLYLSECAITILNTLLHLLELVIDLLVQAILQLLEILNNVILSQLVCFKSPFRFCFQDSFNLP